MLKYLKEGNNTKAASSLDNLLSLYCEGLRSKDIVDARKELILLNARVQHLRNESRLGLLRKEDELLEINRINKALLDVYHEIPDWVIQAYNFLEDLEKMETKENITQAEKNLNSLSFISFLEENELIGELDAWVSSQFEYIMHHKHQTNIGLVTQRFEKRSVLINNLLGYKYKKKDSECLFKQVQAESYFGRGDGYFEIIDNRGKKTTLDIKKLQSFLEGKSVTSNNENIDYLNIFFKEPDIKDIKIAEISLESYEKYYSHYSRAFDLLAFDVRIEEINRSEKNLSSGILESQIADVWLILDYKKDEEVEHFLNKVTADEKLFSEVFFIPSLTEESRYTQEERFLSEVNIFATEQRLKRIDIKSDQIKEMIKYIIQKIKTKIALNNNQKDDLIQKIKQMNISLKELDSVNESDQKYSSERSKVSFEMQIQINELKDGVNKLNAFHDKNKLAENMLSKRIVF